MRRHRLGLLSDVHGNELALDAVLRAIDRVGVDEIACLGDVATLGPRPNEVVAKLAERCAYSIMGNHDEYLIDASSLSLHTTSPVSVGLPFESFVGDSGPPTVLPHGEYAVIECTGTSTKVRLSRVELDPRALAMQASGRADTLQQSPSRWSLA